MQSNEYPFIEAFGRLKDLLAYHKINLTAITVENVEQQFQLAELLTQDNPSIKLKQDYLWFYDGVELRHD